MNEQQRKAMELALEALELINSSDNDRDFLRSDECRAMWVAIDSLQEALSSEALEQPEQRSVSEHLEPVAEIHSSTLRWIALEDNRPTNALLYTTPPQRKPLTDKQVREIAKQYALSLAFPYGGKTTPEMFARAIEAAHGIKENI